MAAAEAVSTAMAAVEVARMGMLVAVVLADGTFTMIATDSRVDCIEGLTEAAVDQVSTTVASTAIVSSREMGFASSASGHRIEMKTSDHSTAKLMLCPRRRLLPRSLRLQAVAARKRLRQLPQRRQLAQ